MKRVLLIGAVVSSLALSACGGSSPSAKPATPSFKTSLASLGGSPDLQVALAASFTGAGSTTAEAILKQLSFTLDFSNPSGGALSQSKGNASVDIVAKIGDTTFIDARVINSNIYFKANVTALSSLSGVKIPSAELAEVQLVFGGRWFELPTSVLNALVPKNEASKVKNAESSAVEYKVVDDITKAIDAGSHTSLGNGGYTDSGTLLSIDEAVLPTLDTVQHVSQPTGQATKGTYSITIAGTATKATSASIVITAPNSGQGNASATITATFTHAGVAVSTPSGATEITPALIKQLESGA
jgi:hypothetical protein